MIKNIKSICGLLAVFMAFAAVVAFSIYAHAGEVVKGAASTDASANASTDVSTNASVDAEDIYTISYYNTVTDYFSGNAIKVVQTELNKEPEYFVPTREGYKFDQWVYLYEKPNVVREAASGYISTLNWYDYIYFYDSEKPKYTNNISFIAIWQDNDRPASAEGLVRLRWYPTAGSSTILKEEYIEKGASIDEHFGFEYPDEHLKQYYTYRGYSPYIEQLKGLKVTKGNGDEHMMDTDYVCNWDFHPSIPAEYFENAYKGLTPKLNPCYHKDGRAKKTVKLQVRGVLQGILRHNVIEFCYYQKGKAKKKYYKTYETRKTYVEFKGLKRKKTYMVKVRVKRYNNVSKWSKYVKVKLK